MKKIVPQIAQFFQFSSVQLFDRLDRRGDIRDDSAEILFQSFLQEQVEQDGWE